MIRKETQMRKSTNSARLLKLNAAASKVETEIRMIIMQQGSSDTGVLNPVQE
jgi:hypothetical protein